MAFPFVQDNSTSRQRLATITSSLSDEELTRSTPSGWTVAGLLAHLAFMDRRVFVLSRRWKEQGVDDSPLDNEAINEAMKPICLALEPRKAVELCLSAAAAVDAEIETLTPELFEQIQIYLAAHPFHIRFNRSLHRNDHLNEIEKIIRHPGLPSDRA